MVYGDTKKPVNTGKMGIKRYLLICLVTPAWEWHSEGQGFESPQVHPLSRRESRPDRAGFLRCATGNVTQMSRALSRVLTGPS